MPIDFSDLGATPVTPTTQPQQKMDLSDLGATPVNTSASPVDPQVADLLKVFNSQDYEKLTPEQKQQYEAGFNKNQGNFQEAAARGIEQGGGLLVPSPAALSSSFEKNVVAPIGDALTGNDTSSLYNNLSPAQMQAQYNAQIQAGQKKDPLAFSMGNIVGSAPAYALGGAAAGTLATGLGASLGTGAGLTGEAANAITTGQKFAQGAINVPIQGAATGALSATQGYNANPAASPEDRLAAAKKSGIIGTALGSLGALAGETPGIISTLGKNSSNKVLANASLGAEGVNTATAAGRQAITAKGEELAGRVAAGVTNLNDTLGKQGAEDINNMFSNAAKDAQTSVETIVNKTANNLQTLFTTDAPRAEEVLNAAMRQSLTDEADHLGLQGNDAVQFIEGGLTKYGTLLNQQRTAFASNNTSLPFVDKIRMAMRDFWNAPTGSPTEAAVQKRVWKEYAPNLYDMSEKAVQEIQSTTPGFNNSPSTLINKVTTTQKGVAPQNVPAPNATPSFAQLPSDQLPPGLPKPPTQLPAPQTVVPETPPVAQTLTPQQIAMGRNPEIPPGTEGVNAPFKKEFFTNARRTSGEFLTPGETPQPFNEIGGTQVTQTATPKETIPFAQAEQMYKVLNEVSGGAKGQVSGTAGKAAQQLNELINTTAGGDFQKAKQIYSNLKTAKDTLGDNPRDWVQNASSLINKGKGSDLNTVFDAIDQIDPQYAATLKQDIINSSNKYAALSKANTPLQKAAVLQQQGLATPEVNQAATTLQNQGQVQSQIGTTPEQIRKFVSGLTPQDVGSKADLDRILGVLDQVSPETSAMLRSEGTQNAVNQNNTLAAGANQSPLDQFNTLKSAGVNSEAAQQAADNLKKLDLVNKGIGGTNDLGMPSDKTRDFIKNFGKSTDTPNGSATAADTQAIIQKLAGIDPTLAAAVESEAPTVGRQLRAIDYSQSGSGMGSNVVTKALGGVGAAAAKGANLVGQGSRILTSASPAGKLGAASATSVANKSNGGADDLLKLANVIQNTPEQLGQFAEPLKAAAARGSDALAAMNYALYNSDSKYRDIINPWQAVTQQTK